MARSSLLLLASLSVTGCLVTDVPDFAEPTPTRPFMIESTAIPATSELLFFEKDLMGSPFAPVDLNVEVVSEDDGRPVFQRLFLAGRTPVTTPRSFSAGPPLAAGSLSSDTRTLTAASFRPPPETMVGCYELFWIATHENDFSDCPADPADAAQISWTVLVCEGDCEAADMAGCFPDPQRPCLGSDNSP